MSASAPEQRRPAKSGRAVVERWLQDALDESPSTQDIERLLLDLADAASVETNVAALRRAARALFQSNGGRPRKDDRRRLERVASLMAKGMPCWPACDRIADSMPDPPIKRHSLAERLHKQVTNNEKKESGNRFPD
jgi:hypothetical protein